MNGANMHDTDIDKELYELIQTAMARGNQVQRGLLSKAAERLERGEHLPSELDTEVLEAILDERERKAIGDSWQSTASGHPTWAVIDPAPGTEVVLYELAGEVELRDTARVPDTTSPASSKALRFEAEVHEGLDQFVRMLRTYPLTAKTPEFRVEVRNKLETAMETYDAATQ
jgi:hypothetical protein